jgi:hypothetical protein
MQWLAIEHQALTSTVCLDALHACEYPCAYLRTTCAHVCITWSWHVAAQESQQHEGRLIAQATLPFASRCFKTTAFGANEREASASVAVRRGDLEEVEEDLGQTAFGVK